MAEVSMYSAGHDEFLAAAVDFFARELLAVIYSH
jgi:hypothetical protein